MLNDLDERIVHALAEDARRSYADIGQPDHVTALGGVPDLARRGRAMTGRRRSRRGRIVVGVEPRVEVE
ncbi:AsnC family protein, partial [Streptomyces nigra]